MISTLITTAFLTSAATSIAVANDISHAMTHVEELVNKGQWQAIHNTLPDLLRNYRTNDAQCHYLLLIQALTWQQQGKHREAIKIYQSFRPKDSHYTEARTNLAIAYLRQGWWSDAHREIQTVLGRPLNAEHQNRLRMMLGLSQLQQGFYRDARQTFGLIDLHSRYVGHAWRGIGLCALHTADYTGALNAFQRLKAMDLASLPDGPFMVAFTFDHMNQLTLARLNYEEALLHYQTRIQQLETQLTAMESPESRREIFRQKEQLGALLRQSQYGLATIYDRQ
ncbi:tetratricopeptide repeat protein [Marinimicrobium sp. ARAG 43.8]|uniref:tetratricopeptide repeat protein n=1 Tax=Marinimicrobium sp. ARAG 43.8 TaxID=3418719 RepID=UPI003CF9A2AB